MSPRDRNALIALGVIAVAALAFFLFVGGGEPEEQAAAPTPSVAPPPVVEPTPEVSRPRFRFFSGRDPFLPLVSDEGPGAQGTTPAQTGTDGVEEPPPDAEQTAGGGATTQVGGHSVTLIDISGDTVQVEVDGTTYTVSEGERFAGTFRLTNIQGSCASFTHGDEPFTLCEGGERK
ncbi:MAG TPA: hypothetical protein VGB28_03115 [Actinomycetota bacterium]